MASSPPTLPLSSQTDAFILRIKQLEEKFNLKYGRRPDFFARAPGRVNLIGEHIDYSGYAVLPMAIEQDIVAAVGANDSQSIRLSNIDDKKYSDYSASCDDYVIDKSAPRWHHYFLCGYKGVTEHRAAQEAHEGAAEEQTKCTTRGGTAVGLDVVLSGTVPASAGLSSSSALVCCAALAAASIHSLHLSKVELASLCAQSERYIGTEGGGMDQSISFLAESGTAKLIEFNPIRATEVRLPPGVAFVISNSLVEMNKAATSHFNIRVVECRLACQVLAKRSALNWREVRKLGDLQVRLGLGLAEMLLLVEQHLHGGVYTIDEVCQILDDVSPTELAAISLSQNTIDVKEFRLHDRAQHVFSEAARVLHFQELCSRAAAAAAAGGDRSCAADAEAEHQMALVQQLGKLMSDSHASCRDLYECSCAELDRLVQICRESGALGSRLTGAGWGGCAVSLVLANQVDSFVAKVKSAYYDGDAHKAHRVSDSLFATVPGSGAAILLPASGGK